MERPTLVVLNVIAVLSAFAVLFYTWFYLPREMVGWGVEIAFLLLLLAILANAVKLVIDYLDSGKVTIK